MISFRTKADTGASIAIIVALLVILGTAAFMLFVPEPSAKGLASAKIKARNDIDEQIKKLKEDKALLTGSIVKRLWTLPPEQIGPKALESITAYARQEKLTLKAFRPQKPNEVNGLLQLPFLISIEGPFPNLMRFLTDLQKAELKLGTSVVQVANTDPNSDFVSATVGVVAYRPLEANRKTEPTKLNAKEKN